MIIIFPAFGAMKRQFTLTVVHLDKARLVLRLSCLDQVYVCMLCDLLSHVGAQ